MNINSLMQMDKTLLKIDALDFCMRVLKIIQKLCNC